jgi:rare lipoprotein A
VIRLAIALAAAAVIAGCASPSVPGAGESSVGPAPGAGAGSTRRGAYYLDDGPGDRAPDPDSVVEPVPRPEAVLERTTRPYVIFGREYRPMSRMEPYRARGVATWYGRRYHGNPTASGERYDMYALTAAHPILPIPSYARVTNLSNGRSVIVRINDRGPFLRDRLIDLSYTAAARLGYVEAGSAQVEVELITQFGQAPLAAPEAGTGRTGALATAARLPESAAPAVVSPVPAQAGQKRGPDPVASPAPSVAPPERLTLMTEVVGNRSRTDATDVAFWLQLGAFASADNAGAARERLARQVGELGAQLEVVAEGGMFKIQAGPWPSRAEALVAADRLHASTGFRPFTTQR